jgi:hypothetical protein
MADVSVIIVNYNTRTLLRACLQHLCDLAEAGEIIVVDNASDDGSAQMVRGEFPAVTLIEQRENRGLAAASNRGIAIAHHELILHLGSDAFPDPGTITGMARYMQAHPDVGIATAQLRLRDGRLDMDAHRGFPRPWASFTHFSGLGKLFPRSKLFNRYFLGHLPLDTSHEIDLCISHFMLVRQRLFREIGGWDEDFFLYGEDVDLCWRAKAAGYSVMYLPQFGALHYKGASIGVRQQTADIATASAETRRNAAAWSTAAMRLFYQKHLRARYPRVINVSVLTAIRLLGLLRRWRAG